jgi:hypothetical protein
MAVYKLFPEKDATLYSQYPLSNTGIDEIVEANTTPSQFNLLTSLPQASRFLIKFSQQELITISASLVAGSPTHSANLKLYAANVTNISETTTLQVLAVSGSWNNGTGKYGDVPPTTNGVSWLYRSSELTDPWLTASFTQGSTGSFPTTNPGGGNWYTSPQYTASQVFEYANPVDVNVDVTSTVDAWLQGVISNDGFILKQKDEFIDSSSHAATLKFFSIDTNTIYPPCLELKWRDCQYNTGSNPTITGSNIYVSLENNPGTFNTEAVNKFRLNVRPKFPTRVFQATPLYNNNFYLPTSSYYAIQDVDTNEYIVEFDNVFTQISADTQSSYFTVYMNGLEPERYYKILIKTILEGSTYIIDENYYFKITK